MLILKGINPWVILKRKDFINILPQEKKKFTFYYNSIIYSDIFTKFCTHLLIMKEHFLTYIFKSFTYDFHTGFELNILNEKNGMLVFFLKTKIIFTITIYFRANLIK